MINYEKTRLVNGSIYEIVPGDPRGNTDRSKLTIITLLGGRTLSEMDSETEVAENITTVTILDAPGEEMDIRKEHKCQAGCKKQENYVVGRGAVDKDDLDEDAIAEYKDVTVTVVVIELATGDARAKLNGARAQTSELDATVDTLLVTSLEE